MRILLEPKVYLIERPSLVMEGLEDFLEEQNLDWPTPLEGTDAETVVEAAGRCCYMSFGKKAGSKTNHAYIQNLLGRNKDGTFKSGPAHGSVVEHPNWTFLVVGAGRGFSHEQVRHRAGWAYSQLSTRYCDFEREEEEGTWDPGFVVPPLAQLTDRTKMEYIASIDRAVESYKQALHNIMGDLEKNEAFQDRLASFTPRERQRMLRKAARGAARGLLPICSEAIMTMSANARAIWNTIYLRANEHAEAPIRAVYVQIAKIMEKEMPALFHGLDYYKTWDGSECVKLPRDNI